jgi:hypothetical protein
LWGGAEFTRIGPCGRAFARLNSELNFFLIEPGARNGSANRKARLPPRGLPHNCHKHKKFKQEEMYMCTKSSIQYARSGWAIAALAFVSPLAAYQVQERPPDPPATADPHAGHQMPQEAPAQQETAPMQDHSQMQSQAPAQGSEAQSHENMPGMNHGSNTNAAGAYLMTLASGTSMNPESWQMPMLAPKSIPKFASLKFGSNLMIMGQAYLIDTQQSGERGGDKLYSSNWIMIAKEHRLGRGSILFETMLSLEPATVANRSYPLLFQTGETAYGTALTDAQHPHDFVMSLGLHYAHPIGENILFHAYYAPVGDPALGPVAFPHRASASELPQAPISHHVQDSTHIASNVATIGIKNKWIGVEASGFYGTEPDENRWNIDWGPMNSYSGRISFFPSKNWLAQVSAGRLKSPERQTAADHAPENDVVRVTASVHYTRPMAAGNAWSTSLIWGRNHGTGTRRNTNSYLAETLYPLSRRDFLTGRVELVDKDELFANNPALEEQIARAAGSTFRVEAFTAGYTRDFGTFRNVETGLGMNLSAYGLPDAIKPYYGDRPWGANIYLRFRLHPSP